MPVKPLVITYIVILSTRKGDIEVDVPSALGPDAAARRAQWTIIAQRKYGDVPDISVLGVHPICGWFAACDRVATGTLAHPALGDVPICDRCRAMLPA